MTGPTNYKCHTVDPDNPTGPRITVEIPADLYTRFYKYNPVRYENLRAVKHVLDNPKRIFWGVRKYNQGGWCYVGKPDEWYIKPGVAVPFPENKVFTVYVNPLRRVYEYGAEPAASDDPSCPIDWKSTDRYRGLKWKSTS